MMVSPSIMQSISSNNVSRRQSRRWSHNIRTSLATVASCTKAVILAFALLSLVLPPSLSLQCAVKAFQIIPTRTYSFSMYNKHSPSKINNNILHERHQNNYLPSSSRLLLGVFEEDTITTTTTTSDDNNNNNSNAVRNFFQPGSGPTVIIETNEPSDEIYASAITRTISWVLAAALFGLGIFLSVGEDSANEFFAGYLVEQSLSVDNLFVFLLLFDYFKVPLKNQDRVLNYGIYGAIVMRATMIGLGTVALREYDGVLLLFAGILIYSSANVLINMGNDEEDEEDMSENSIVKFSKKLFDATDEFDGNQFFTMIDGVKKATPLFICLVAVEISDVVFAVDSIPAVFGVTENPLIVFSSNMFAIMGLRSLYTILSKAAQDLEYLEPAVAVVLGFIGSKMVAEYFGIHIPTELSLGVVLTFLSGGIGLSVFTKNLREQELEQGQQDKNK
mmetsp:Transcript_2282/g.2738  ORF Transcript_2282/g.2738 Transcript_2282/m.2738 type:complete len:447 (-) Transcript_2282:231-1571(-)